METYKNYINKCYAEYTNSNLGLAKEIYLNEILPNISLDEFILIVKFYAMVLDVWNVVDVQPSNYADTAAFKRWCYTEYFMKYRNQDKFIQRWNEILMENQSKQKDN